MRGTVRVGVLMSMLARGMFVLVSAFIVVVLVARLVLVLLTRSVRVSTGGYVLDFRMRLHEELPLI